VGAPVQTRHRALAERILVDALHAEGHDDPTPYSLQTWYLDFGRRVPVDHLQMSVLMALDPRWDVACNAPADPRLAAALRQAHQDGDAEATGRLRVQVETLSRRALLTVAVFSARFQSARLGLKTIDASIDLTRLGFGTCRFVAERRVGRSLHGDPRYFVPLLGRREGFCHDHCLTRVASHPDDDAPAGTPRSAGNCAMSHLLEGVRFFASFADE